VEKAVSSRNYRIGCDAVRFLMASQVRGHHQALSAAISPSETAGLQPAFPDLRKPSPAGRCRWRNGSARMSTHDPNGSSINGRFRAVNLRPPIKPAVIPSGMIHVERLWPALSSRSMYAPSMSCDGSTESRVMNSCASRTPASKGSCSSSTTSNSRKFPKPETLSR
jgi:hypothetical protein